MNLNNKVVKAYTYTQAKQIIQWFNSNGVDSSFFHDEGWLPNALDGSIHQYYGIINGRFEYWAKNQVDLYDAQIIELPKERVSEPILNVIL